ncbi:MAG: hypothetical protein LBU31_04595 [Coriobacteriales bacterium]|jgi:hypothetical protein|nr:hypothetical protein [Coriobacteriales bacterium]
MPATVKQSKGFGARLLPLLVALALIFGGLVALPLTPRSQAWAAPTEAHLATNYAQNPPSLRAMAQKVMSHKEARSFVGTAQIGNHGSPIISSALLGTGDWSLLSLMLSVIAIILSLFLAIGAFIRRCEEEERQDGLVFEGADGVQTVYVANRTVIRYEADGKQVELLIEEQRDEDERRRRLMWRVLAIMAGILTPVVWLFLDDLTKPMVFVNRYTAAVTFIFLVHVALCVIHYIRKNCHKDKDESELEVQLEQVEILERSANGFAFRQISKG